MEENLAHGGMISGGSSYGGLDLQGSMRVHHPSLHPQSMPPPHHPHHHQGPPVHAQMPEGYPRTMGAMQNCDQIISMAELNKGERSKASGSDDEEPSFTEEGADGQNDANKGKKGSPWSRVKWTDKMVKLLITAVSYIGEDVGLDCGIGGRRKSANLQRKGKWKSVSKVLAERGFHVSPQQCEDKFNDLNKRYKKLNDIIGRGTSCQVVENPALLDVLDYLSEKEKDDVRKILSSKQLFYEEMCSYHNGNRLHLPHDPALQRSLQLALKSRNEEDDDVRRHQHDDHDEDDPDMETDDRDEYEDNHTSHVDARGMYGMAGCSGKRMKQGQIPEDISFGRGLHSHPHAQTDANQVSGDGTRAAWMQKQWIESCTLQLEEQKLQIQAEMLELEKQRFKWERFNRKRDRELELLRMENERMKLENDRMALELKQKEMELNQ